MNEEPTAMSATLLAAQARRGQRLTLRDPAPAGLAAPKAAELPKAPPRVEASPPESEPARRPAVRKPEGGRAAESTAAAGRDTGPRTRAGTQVCGTPTLA